MKKKSIIILCTMLPVAALAAFFYRHSHRKYSTQ